MELPRPEWGAFQGLPGVALHYLNMCRYIWYGATCRNDSGRDWDGICLSGAGVSLLALAFWGITLGCMPTEKREGYSLLFIKPCQHFPTRFQCVIIRPVKLGIMIF